MTEPPRPVDVHEPMPRTNKTTIALIGGLLLLVIMIAYFATSRNSDQDKLTNVGVATSRPVNREKLCASSTTYDLIKRELFRRAAQLRGSDQAAYDRLAGYAVVRMENPVMDSQDGATGAVNCSGSLSLDLPPGVAVVGGRRTLSSDVDYSVTPAADGTGTVILLRNADSIVTPLATVNRISQPTVAQAEQGAGVNQAAPESGTGNSDAAPAGEPSQPPAVPQRPASARPSFDCANARSRGEVAVCSEAGLAALDRQMAAQYGRAFAGASPDQRDLLRDTARRFYTYRDRCPDNRCVGDAYIGRMREIRDIMEGRWQAPR